MDEPITNVLFLKALAKSAFGQIMNWKLTDAEMRAVLRLEGPKRYGHCIKRIADCEELWGLRAVGGWAYLGDAGGRELFPVWPHADYARLLATGEWQKYQAEAIALDAWIERWLPGLERDGRHVAVFPTPGMQGVVVEPSRLLADLQNELAKYG